MNSAPPWQVVVEMLNDDVHTFSREDMDHVLCGGCLGYYDEPVDLDLVAQTIRDPDGWIEFGGATVEAGENDWEPVGEARYSRGTIFSRHVVTFVTVYDEPARMDLPEDWD